MLGGDQTHTLLYGGARSGKTFAIVRAIIIRAAKVPRSRHLMARFRLVDIEGSIVHETWPKVVELCFPEMVKEIEQKKADRYFLFPNGSEVWWAGLDDKERTEKILGKEFATIYLGECSQIPWASRTLAMTRLAQKTWVPNPLDPDGSKGLDTLPGLRLKAYYDENPPLKTHWTHKVFIEKKSPDTGKLLASPENFNSMLLNPGGNAENLDPKYLKELSELPDRAKKRFLYGQFGEADEGALWTDELLTQQRINNDRDVPDFQRIVIGVDPSGARDVDDMHRDEIGIVVVGLGTDGNAYVLEDLTMRGSPGEWGEAVVGAYLRWGADRVIAETNFGGAMVTANIQAAAAAKALKVGHPITVNVSEVTASRGKVVRAEPISGLYEQQKVWHLEGLIMLETELVNFTTAGYLGDRSPNRADALIWACTALFHAVVRSSKEEARGRGSPGPKVNLGHANLKRRYGARLGR